MSEWRPRPAQASASVVEAALIMSMLGTAANHVALKTLRWDA